MKAYMLDFISILTDKATIFKFKVFKLWKPSMLEQNLGKHASYCTLS
jgi:hypothetical protein